MTKSLAKKVKSRQLTVNSIDEKLIDINLKGNLRLSDPDLLVRFGLTSSNMGFLPWHIRLTEIHDISTHLDIECWDVFQVLLRYSKCDQRFGRWSISSVTTNNYFDRVIKRFICDLYSIFMRIIPNFINYISNRQDEHDSS